MTIYKADGDILLSVEVARTPQEQAKGLMFRTKLPSGHGMYFPFNPPRPARFWMKNTPLSLDIIYIGPDDRIESIHPNTAPYSLERILSHGDVKGTLEIVGGDAAAKNIAVGDKIAIHYHDKAQKN